MDDWVAYAALGVSAVAIGVSLLGYFEEKKKRILLEKMVKQMVRLAKSQERQVKALVRTSGGRSPAEIQLERDQLTWDKIKTIGRALGFDVDP